jgi:hypothetical protein
VGIRRADHETSFLPQKLAPTSSTSDGRSVGIVHSRTKATELVVVVIVAVVVVIVAAADYRSVT